MMYLFFIILISFLYPSLPVEESCRIRVMTYNIRLDHAGDAADNWHFRKNELVSFLNAEQPDFIGIQEGLWHQVQFMDSLMADYDYIGVGRDDGKSSGEMMAIFYLNQKWNLKESNTFWLSDDPGKPGIGWDAACNRTVTYGVFNLNDQDVEIAISNTHLDHVGKIARSKSIELIGQHIQGLDKDLPHFLIGDFNFVPEDPLYNQLSGYIKDTYHLADTLLIDHPGTFNGFRIDPNYPRRIDYIWADVNRLHINKHEVMTPMTISERHLSDHFPVVVDATIKSIKE